MKPVEKWMLGALNKNGNTVLSHARVRLFGIQAIIDEFANYGYNVRIREEQPELVTDITGNPITNKKERKCYIVEVIRNGSK